MRKRRALKATLVSASVLVVLYMAIIGYFMYAEKSLVYSPEHKLLPIASVLQNDQAVTFASGDGTKLSGRILLAEQPTKHWVYFLHGNLGNVSTCQSWWLTIHRAGVNLFVLDYRGYGESEGLPSERGLYDDAEAGYRYLVQQQHVTPSDMIVYGHSMGASVAIDLAMREPVAGLVVQGAMVSVDMLGKDMYPYLPVSFILRDHFDSAKKITQVKCPKLFMHSLQDHIVPFRQGQELYNLASQPKEFIVLQGGHNDAIKLDREKVINALIDFNKRIVQTQSEASTHGE